MNTVDDVGDDYDDNKGMGVCVLEYAAGKEIGHNASKRVAGQSCT
jgi:hypothetical protein